MARSTDDRKNLDTRYLRQQLQAIALHFCLQSADPGVKLRPSCFPGLAERK